MVLHQNRCFYVWLSANDEKTVSTLAYLVSLENILFCALGDGDDDDDWV